jgi:hypothetical protein
MTASGTMNYWVFFRIPGREIDPWQYLYLYIKSQTQKDSTNSYALSEIRMKVRSMTVRTLEIAVFVIIRNFISSKKRSHSYFDNFSSKIYTGYLTHCADIARRCDKVPESCTVYLSHDLVYCVTLSDLPVGLANAIDYCHSHVKQLWRWVCCET